MNKFSYFFLLFGTVEASLIGNPSDPEILEEGFWISDRCFSSLRAGASGDLMFEKRLRSCRASQKQGISCSEMNWTLVFADVGWNIRERFDVHLLGGPASAVQFQWRQNGNAYRASGNRGAFWGLSSKLVLLEIENTTLGADFHGGVIEGIEGPILQNSNPRLGNFHSRLYFWQIAAGISQNIKSLRPYAGAVVNQSTCIVRPNGMKPIRFHDLVKVGAYEGCSVSFGSKIFLNVEIRQFFETALSIAGEFRF